MSASLQLSSTVIAAIIAHLMAAVAGILLYRHAYNWRVKFISLVVVFVPVYQVIRLIREAEGWPTVGSGQLPEMAELAVAAMFLVSVLVLKKESHNREHTEKRLRLAEGVAGFSTQGPSQGLERESWVPVRRRKSRRRCLHCDRPIRGWRKWTSNSPFCSDQHREYYYTMHAASRLGRLATAVGLSRAEVEPETAPEPR